MPNYQLNQVNTVLLPEFQNWVDEYGLNSDRKNDGVSGNGTLYTAHYALGLKIKGLLTEKERNRLIEAVSLCFDAPGLIDRSVAKELDYQAHDDYLGLLTLAMILDKPEWTQQVLEYGKNVRCDGIDESETDPKKAKLNKLAFTALKILKFGKVNWVWNNRNYGKFHVSSWLGRRFDVTATMKLAAGKAINPIHWLYWSFYILTVGDKSSHDSWILRFHMVTACESRGFLTKFVIKKFKVKMVNKFGDFGNLLAQYFNNPENPLPKFLEGVK